MFRRKEDSDSDTDTDLLSRADDDAIDTSASNTSSESSAAAEPAPSASSTPTPAAAPTATAAKPVPTAAAFRPQTAPNLATRAPIPSADTRTIPAASSGSPKASKRILTVGNDIHMKGEISTCDRLVIEGSVDAELKDVHTVELAETGSFKGTAEIEDAEISGIFEGDLIVNGRLIIYATGQVRGNIAYGEIEIERGGQLSGTIKSAAQAKAESKNKMKVA